MHVPKKTEGWGWKLHFQSSCLSLFCLCSLFACRDRLMETQHSGTHSSVLSWRTFSSVSPWAVSHRAAVPPCVHRPVLMPAPSLGDTAQAHCSFLWSLCNSGLKTLVQELAVADVTSYTPFRAFFLPVFQFWISELFQHFALDFSFHKTWACLSSQLHSLCSTSTSLAGDSWALALLLLLHCLSLLMAALCNKLDCPSCIQTLQLLAGGFQDSRSLLSQAVHV